MRSGAIMSDNITHWLRPPHGGAFPVTDSGEPDLASAGPLVLVPGIGGPRGTFYHQVDAFRADRRTVALNLNATRRGGSSAVDSSADDVAFALDELGIDRADIAAASFGTAVST